MTIRVNSIVYNKSVVDGPGIRTVVFLQGCDIHCNGCHNPLTWDPNGGVDYDLNDLVHELDEKSFNKKITISGGEPLLQTEAVSDLLDKLDGFDVCLYTGRDISEIPESILSKLSYVKYGPYCEEHRCTNVPFIGSTNQTFVALRGSEKYANQ